MRGLFKLASPDSNGFSDFASKQSSKLHVRANRVDFKGRKPYKVNFYEKLNLKELLTELLKQTLRPTDRDKKQLTRGLFKLASADSNGFFEFASKQSSKLHVRANRVDFKGRKLYKINFYEKLNLKELLTELLKQTLRPTDRDKKQLTRGLFKLASADSNGFFEFASKQSSKLHVRANRVDFKGRKPYKVNFYEKLNLKELLTELLKQTLRPTDQDKKTISARYP